MLGKRPKDWIRSRNLEYKANAAQNLRIAHFNYIMHLLPIFKFDTAFYGFRTTKHMKLHFYNLRHEPIESHTFISP